ncbi:MAG: 1-deoxy-D-xylulose-5-phosphate reductoisomerase [Desulforhopalus sp.]|jgi:1-deoxy-D-xylulose-5-phosphate reductoisomerase|nr:1-deoxy-D-xylulose-5-phosphate reductoisomerase [Desulforhopalus sp.]
MKPISLLGATGSIGVNVLEVVRKFPDRYQILAMAAGGNVALLAGQVLEFSPELISVADREKARLLKDLLPRSFHQRIVHGTEGACLVAAHPAAEMVISAIVGAAGLLPTLAAISAGKDVGLANKESLVMAGKIVMAAVRTSGVRLIPVDSEHSAIFQALEAGRRRDLQKIILTASGGPFRELERDALQRVTREQALNHPRWRMGEKISIDSATLMNKGLEVIEARWLFDVYPEAIEVVVHPQSVVHSLVEYRDGSVIAQLGIPDMRIPIAYALSYPARLPLELPALNLGQCARLDFHQPDLQRFPALGLAFAALREGGILPTVLNAANEVAVAAFLEGRIAFPEIAETVARTMDIVDPGNDDSLEEILAADQLARQQAAALLGKRN